MGYSRFAIKTAVSETNTLLKRGERKNHYKQAVRVTEIIVRGANRDKNSLLGGKKKIVRSTSRERNNRARQG